jgi:hypothetical protein
MGSEPVFLNVYGAPDLIPRNEFRQRCSLMGWYYNTIPPRFLAPIDFLKIPAQFKTTFYPPAIMECRLCLSVQGPQTRAARLTTVCCMVTMKILTLNHYYCSFSTNHLQEFGQFVVILRYDKCSS